MGFGKDPLLLRSVPHEGWGTLRDIYCPPTGGGRSQGEQGVPLLEAPLKGLKVVELARVLAGPWLGQTLADLGAEVIKVESPSGDDTRQWGPPFIERPRPDGSMEKVAAYFHSTNRGKTSVTCDFTNASDLKKLKALIAQADVLIENFKVGGLAKYGLDYQSLSAANPQLIYTSITGFGQTGPRASQPGYDFLIQGMSGVMDLTGEPAGEPQKVGIAWIDIFTGLYGVIAVQAALLSRAKTGEGQHLDLSLYDCAVGVLANQSANVLLGGMVPTRMGNAHPNLVPYQVFPAADGHLVIATGNDRQYKALCGVLGLAELGDAPDFIDNAARVKNREALIGQLSAKTSKRTRADLIEAMNKAGVPTGPIHKVDEALSDPQTAARGLLISPEGLDGIRSPLVFSKNKLTTEKASPALGAGAVVFRRGMTGN